MARKQEPESQLSRQTYYMWPLRVVLRAHQGLQCLKQMVTSPRSQLGCPNSLNMGSLIDAHRSQYLWQELLRKELYCKADQGRRQGIKSLFNPAAWVKSKGSREFLTWKLIGQSSISPFQLLRLQEARLSLLKDFSFCNGPWGNICIL